MPAIAWPGNLGDRRHGRRCPRSPGPAIMVGMTDASDAVSAAAAAHPVLGPGRLGQGRIYRDGALGRRPLVPVTPERLAGAAWRRMSRRAWAYVAGSAGQQRTARANEAAFERYRLPPPLARARAVRAPPPPP